MAEINQQSLKADDCRILIVGVGNGAGRALSAMARQWQEGPDMVAINTDSHDFAKIDGLRFVQIGAQVMNGMGTGGDPQVGRRAAAEDVDAVRKLFHGVNLVLLVVGLGGGTGTGAAPLVAEEARKAGALVLCFGMLPFEFEGQRRMSRAQQGLLALNGVANGVICLPNQRLLDLVEDRANIAEAFQKADAMLGRGVQAIWRVLCRKGVINLDFADVQALLQQGNGQCVFGCAEGEGPDRINLILQALREDPMLKRGQVLAQAHAYIISISGAADLTLKDVDSLVRGIGAAGGAESLAMVGVDCDAALKDRIFVTILASEPAGEAPVNRDPVPAEPVKPAVVAKPDLIQGTLFDGAGQGRFKDVDPTIIEGSNLDIPTFIRRRIMIQKTRDGHS